jgi:hypothetical protein
VYESISACTADANLDVFLSQPNLAESLNCHSISQLLPLKPLVTVAVTVYTLLVTPDSVSGA